MTDELPPSYYLNTVLSNTHGYHGYKSSLKDVLVLFLQDYFKRLVAEFPEEKETYWQKRVIDVIKWSENSFEEVGDTLTKPTLKELDSIYRDEYKSIDIYYILKIAETHWFIPESNKESKRSIQNICFSVVDRNSSVEFKNALSDCRKCRNKAAHESKGQIVEDLDVQNLFKYIDKICRCLPLNNNQELVHDVYGLLLLIYHIQTEKGWKPLDIDDIMSRPGNSCERICYVPSTKYKLNLDYDKCSLTDKKTVTLSNSVDDINSVFISRDKEEIKSNRHQTNKVGITDKAVTSISSQNNVNQSIEIGLNTMIRDINEYITAAENGNSDAQYYLCVCYENGIDVQINKKKAFEWLCKSASAGNIKALNKIGRCYWFGVLVDKDEKKAFYWNELAAKKGVAEAQNRVGHYYCNGCGVEKDEVKAVEWFFKAAEQGNAVAQYNLGICFRNGYGVKKDDEKAVEWYEKSAEQGDMKAQNNLGIHYERGEGVEKDFEKAFKLYSESANQGWADGQCNLASCYYRGIGIEKDVVKAIEWYIRSANQGCLEAQTFLKTHIEENE